MMAACLVLWKVDKTVDLKAVRRDHTRVLRMVVL